MNRASNPLASATLVLALCLAAPACASAGQSGGTGSAAETLTPEETAMALDRQIEETREAVRRDREQLQDLLVEPRAADAPPLSEDPAFRELAEHLVALELELADLSGRRFDLEAQAPSP